MAPAKKNAVTSEVSGIQKPKAMDLYRQKLDLEAGFRDEVNASEISAQVVEQMLNAESPEALFAMQDSSLPSGKSIVNVEHEVLSFEVVKGDPKYESHSLGYYLVVDAVRLDTGEQFKYSCGAPNVVTVLWKLRDWDQLPMAMVIRSRDTQNGELLSILPVGNRAIKH